MGPPGQPNDRRVGVITAHRPAVISNPRCGVNDVADEELLQAFELRVDALSEACLRRGPVQTPSSLMFFEFHVSRRTQFSYMYTTQDSHCTKASARRVRDNRRYARPQVRDSPGCPACRWASYVCELSIAAEDRIAVWLD